jgi:adenosylcobyric acid synthase
VFAQLLGTKAALAPDDAAAIVGFVVNKFRGDASLFADGMRIIEERTGWRAFGLAPFFPEAARLPAEDAFSLPGVKPREGAPINIVVPQLARIANFDDFDPLRLEPAVRLVFVPPGEPLPVCDCVILPGSKATMADLGFLRTQGWDIDLLAHVRRGGRVLGICGGYQMLGRRIADPEGIEGPAGAAEGLGLLDVETILGGDKTLERVEGICAVNDAPFAGYEMHVGKTSGSNCARPYLRLSDGRSDGAVSANRLVAGAYVHGLFADDRQRAAFLSSLGGASEVAYEALVERTLDRLADHLEQNLDCESILAAAL